MFRYVALLLSVTLTASAAAEPKIAKRSQCDPIAGFKVIGTEPTRLTEGNCPGYLQIPPKACFYYNAKPGGKAIGPICLDAEKGKGGAKLGPVYQMWAKDSPFTITLVPQR